MNRCENKSGFRLPISSYISYLLLVSVLLTTVTVSKFMSNNDGIDGARVSHFGVDISASDVYLDIEAGSTASYSFTLKNTADVVLNYHLVMEGVPVGIGITVNDGKAYNESRIINIGESQTLVLTFSADDDMSDTNTSVNISVYAEQED